MRRLRWTSIGFTSAWLPSRRSTLHQIGACAITRPGHCRSVSSTWGDGRYFETGIFAATSTPSSPLMYRYLPGHRDRAGARDVGDPVRTQQLQEALDPVELAGHLDDHLLGARVHDAPAEAVHLRHRAIALRTRDHQLHQRQLPAQLGRLGQVLDLDHLDQPVELLLDLVDL